MAITNNVTNYHMQYLDVTSQHWHPASEKFAGGDHLLTALENDWEVAICVDSKFFYTAERFVRVYQFNLIRGNEKMHMPVIYNPYIERFIDENEINLVDEADHDASVLSA